MREIHKTLRVGAIVCIAWFAAAALTPLTSVAIRNSTMDSTTVGATTPATGRFTTTVATNNAAIASGASGQGAYSQWNLQGIGDADFITQRGSGVGGFNWYNATNSGALGSPIMSLSGAGTLSAPAGIFSQLAATAPFAPGSVVNGGWVGWGQSSGSGPNLGEMDFIAQSVSGAGGFNWYNTNSSSAGTAIARMDGSGNLSLRSITASAGFSGNASTASALAVNPSNCTGSNYATGIQADGTADCVALPNIQHGVGSNCTTGSASYSTCNSVVAWSSGFSDTNYEMTCTMIGPSDPRANIVGVASKTGAGANVTITTTGSVAISFSRLDCIAYHN